MQLGICILLNRDTPMSDMKLIMENWDGFLNENKSAGQIMTIGELVEYFKQQDPSNLKKFAMKYGGYVAKVMGITTGAAAGAATGGLGVGAGIAAGVVAEQVVEQMLQASIMAFANIEDGTYPAGSAAAFFDLDDDTQLFVRDLETKGTDITKASKPELEVFKIMKKKIEDAVQGGIPPETRIADLLQNITAQAVMKARLQAGEHSGKVKIEPLG